MILKNGNLTIVGLYENSTIGLDIDFQSAVYFGGYWLGNENRQVFYQKYLILMYIFLMSSDSNFRNEI